MTNNPQISVIIPVYKVASYLPQFFSELKEVGTSIEFIFIDDGSPDDSGALLDQLSEGDARFHVIHQPNSGVAVARNAGLKAARGEYIAFVDPDDHVSSNYFNEFSKSASETGADLLVCEWREDDGKSLIDHKIPGSPRVLSNEYVLTEIMRSTVILGSLWAKLFKAELIKSFHFPVQKTNSDFMVSCKAVGSAKSIVFVSAPKYVYTSRRSDSLQNSQREKDIEGLFKVHLQLSSYLEEYYPALDDEAELDILNMRVQACVHICKSSVIADKRSFFKHYQKGLLSKLPFYLRQESVLQKKVLFGIVSLGYFPTRIALSLRAHTK